MKYYQVDFTLNCPADLLQDVRDVLAAMAGNAGFETFEETSNGLTGYVQQQLFDSEALQAVVEAFPFGDDVVRFKVEEAEDRDWNEQWEQAGFEPIVVDGGVIIHDGRHLPHLSNDKGPEERPSPIVIEIDAHQAFGTGTHETTRMMCSLLTSLDLDGLRVLDCGTGTGILSICALKAGAQQATGYDIDEWSVENARHNAIINYVDSRFKVLHGDATLLSDGTITEPFDIIVANINRNILLNDMPLFCRHMAHGSRMLLSGFYESDVDMLTERASTLGLALERQLTDGGWASLMFRL